MPRRAVRAEGRIRGIAMKINAQKVKKTALNYLKTLIFPVAMWLLFLIISAIGGSVASFTSGSGFEYIFRQSVLPTIVALAIALPLSGGRWDFATGTIVVLGGIIGGNIGLAISQNAVVILLCCIVSATLLAAIEAIAYIVLRVPNMIVSLGIVMVYESFTSILFDGLGVQLNRYDSVIAITQAPWCYIILAVILIVMYVLLERTKFGADCKSLGRNAPLAINSGVKEKKNIFLTYIVVGVLLGVAAVFNACQANVTPVSNLGSTSVMYSSMGAVLVGLFLADFTCMPWGVWVGAVGMQVMTYGMVCSGIDSSLQTVVTGVVIVLIVVYTSNQAAMVRAVKKLFARISPKKADNKSA